MIRTKYCGKNDIVANKCVIQHFDVDSFNAGCWLNAHQLDSNVVQPCRWSHSCWLWVLQHYNVLCLCWMCSKFHYENSDRNWWHTVQTNIQKRIAEQQLCEYIWHEHWTAALWIQCNSNTETEWTIALSRVYFVWPHLDVVYHYRFTVSGVTFCFAWYFVMVSEVWLSALKLNLVELVPLLKLVDGMMRLLRPSVV